MKKHLFLALVIFLSVPAMAQLRSHHGGGHQSPNSTLTILSTDRQGFWLFVDDVLQNENPVRSICVRNFWPDDYHIRVEMDNKLHNCVGQYVNMSRSQSLNIAQFDGLLGLDFTQAHIRPELTMDLLTAPMPPAPSQPIVQPSLPPQPASPCMNERDFDEVMALIGKETFDNSRLTVAKQVVSSNPLCARQISSICGKFSFENNKLEFAKYAYAYCTDKNKYYLLNETFTYDASKQELNEFIQGL
ncbi:MAG: DUF4476 domain-containing protein [Bacteroidales bacterium]|nr:DUF4476 domain-containing protein [Bacteroidales bacterium]